MSSRRTDPWCLVRSAHVLHDPELLGGLLDAAERSRLDRMSSAADRRRFVTAAALLRVTVAAHVEVDPRDVVIDRTCPDCGRPHGRPRIDRSDPGVHVSVSHAGDIAMVALTEAGPVGVDVESIPDTYLDVIEVACHPAERAAISSARDFAVAWVRKESVLKADGAGLRRDPTAVVVASPSDRAALRSMPGRRPNEVQLHDVPVDGRHVAAVAVLVDDEAVGLRVEDVTSELAHLAQSGSSVNDATASSRTRSSQSHCEM